MSAHVEVSDRTFDRLRELHERSDRPFEQLLEQAVGWLDRTLVGRDDPAGPRLPFKKELSDHDADIVLRQDDPEDFELEEPFRYVRSGRPDLQVPQGDVTDLASVPTALTWLVPRYGRHTLPALLHDHLVVPGMDPDVREDADALFRDAMAETGVPLVRRWMMWAGVSVATLFKRPIGWKVVTSVWVVVYVLAGIDLFAMITRWYRVPLIAQVPSWLWLLSPVVLSLVWGRRYRFGLISAYCLLVLPVPIVAVGIAGAIYNLSEGVAQVVLRVRARFGATVVVNPVRVAKLKSARRAGPSAPRP
jgi:hypothetical protein